MISPTLDERLHELARRQDMSVSELTRVALRNVVRLNSVDREKVQA